MHLLALLACTDSSPSVSLSLPTWDPAVLAAADGVYARLPHARALARVKKDGSSTRVDLDGATPERLILAPDRQTLLVFASWPVCEDPDEDILLETDCPVELDTAWELDLVRAGAVIARADVPPQFNAFAFSDDGSLAVAYLDLTQASTIEVNGVLNLTEAVFIDLSTGETHPVPVGFAAERVLFTADGTKAVVLSRSQVAMVDLASWSVTVSFPLTLDPDQVVTPSDVALVSHEGTDYALVSVQGREEVYVLDLTNESIDLVEMTAAPADILVDTVADRTLLAYGGRAGIDLLDHDFFEVETVRTDEPAQSLLGGEGMALAYTAGSTYKDVVLLDTVTRETTEFRAENPIATMRLTEDHAFAVATLQPEGGSSPFDAYHGLQIFDLATLRTPVTLALQSSPVGLQVTQDGGATYALLLLDGVDALLRVNLATAQSEAVELAAPPLGIDSMPDGTFVVTHPSSLGLVSFVDAATGEITTASGFAALDLLVEPVLPRRNVE
jgi:hypothetical protein